MIPYALFLFRIICEDEILDVRAHAIAARGFYFRVASEKEEAALLAKRFVACFLAPNEKNYKEYEVSGSVMRDASGLLFVSEDSRFLNDFRTMLSDYTHMIYAKTTQDEEDWMEELSGLRLSDTFSGGRDSFLARFLTANGLQEVPLLPVEIAVWIDNETYLSAFLHEATEDFLDYYYRDNHLDDFSAFKERVTHIYFGDAYCERRLPFCRQMAEAAKKAVANGFVPVFVFSPMKECDTDKYADSLECIGLLAKECGESMEIVVNDYGMPLLLRILTEKGKVEKDKINVTLGPLLNKRKKDPRTAVLKQKDAIYAGNETDMFSDRAATDYLSENLGVSAVSGDATGYDITPGNLPFVLHMPRYQIATSGCVLRNLCKYGERGKVEKAENICEKFCEHCYIAYPENLNVIGIGNSLFGISNREIGDVAYLNTLIGKGLKRIVLRA